MTNNLVFKYYAAVVYPFRHLFKYGYLPKVKIIVPFLSSLFIFNIQNLLFSNIILPNYSVLIYVIIGIILWGFFDMYLFQFEKDTCQKIINLPSKTNRISFLFYFLLLTIFIIKQS